MGVISPGAGRVESFEALYAANVDGFLRYLQGVLGSQARAVIDPEDALQEAMADAFVRWQELGDADPEERDRRLYRLVRDAASEALRREHGRRDRPSRPGVVSYDFGALDSDEEDLEQRDRDLTVTVLGQITRELAENVADIGERRAVLNRAVLLAGLRALTEREAVVFIHVENQGWDQTALADELGIPVAQVYGSLFMARKLFYGVVRHALGIEIDDEERARLHAYRAGELRGREKRLARRHLQHCTACQHLVREEKAFAERAHHVLSPLPFVLGGVLATPVVKSAVGAGAAAGAVSGAGTAAARGLLAQAGATKVLAGTVAILGIGVGVIGWLSIANAPHAVPAARPAVSVDGPQRRSTLTVSSQAKTTTTPAASTSKPAQRSATKHSSTRSRKRKKHKSSAASSSSSGSGSSTPAPPPAPSTAAPSQTPSAPSSSTPASPSGSGSSGGSSSGGSSAGSSQTEFFDG